MTILTDLLNPSSALTKKTDYGLPYNPNYKPTATVVQPSIQPIQKPFQGNIKEQPIQSSRDDFNAKINTTMQELLRA